MAVATLTANRLRSSLTMLGMIIGNASVIAMIGVGQGAQRYAAGQFESLGPNTLFITPGSPGARQRSFDVPRNLTWADARAIATQVPSVRDVAPQLQSQQTLTVGSRKRLTLTVGTTPDFLPVRGFEVHQGRFLTSADVERNARVVVLGCEMADTLFGYTACKIKPPDDSPSSINPINQRIRIRNLSFRIVGILKEKGAFLGTSQDDVVVVPLSTMAGQVIGQRSPFGVSLTFISVAARNEASINAAEFQIANLLRLRHKITNEDDFTIQTQKEALQIISNISSALTIMLAAIAGISLLVGGIGIMNIMLVSVSERTQEIGLRKAIGASEQDILVQFMIEAIILSAAGGLIGTSIGVGTVILVGIFTPLQASVSVPAILLALGVSGGIGLFFGVLPARRAAQLDPIVALRSA